VFEEEDSLPGAKLKSSVGNRDTLACAGEHHAEMACGIVWAFQRMNQSGVILGDEVFKETMEVGTRRRIGILVDHEARAGMLDENCGNSRLDSAAAD